MENENTTIEEKIVKMLRLYMTRKFQSMYTTWGLYTMSE